MTTEQDAIKSAVTQDEDMQASMMQSSQPQDPSQAPQPQEAYSPYAQDYSQAQQGYGYQQEQQYQTYAPPSTDTITEISEQIASEKISQLKTEIEKVIDFKTTIESKIDFIDQRLKRIESTIDRLQISILQKVGEYVNNVQDLRTEVVETQKSFKSLLDKKAPTRKEN